MNLIERLRTERQQRGLSTEQLARKAGVGRATIYKIEAGEVSRPHHRTVEYLADALGIPRREIRQLWREHCALSPVNHRPADTAITVINPKQIEYLRDRRAMDIETVAGAAGISAAAYARLESGQRLTSRWNTIHAIARAFGVEPGEIVMTVRRKEGVPASLLPRAGGD